MTESNIGYYLISHQELFVSKILEIHYKTVDIKDLDNLYKYYIKRPEIIFDDEILCEYIKNNQDEFLELMNTVILPEYFF